VNRIDNLPANTMMLDAVMQSSYDGLWICDGNGFVLKWNRAAERYTGIKAEEIIGKRLEYLIENKIITRSVTIEVLKRKTSVTMIQEIQGKPFLVTGNPFFDKDGKILFVVVNDRDITALEQLKAELDETKALSDRYVARLSELELENLVKGGCCVAKSDPMTRIVKTAVHVGKFDSTVCITGESGVGKSLIAGFIHKNSHRKSGPFIKVDCASIPEPLIESELFGYEKGAFTGAISHGKPGFFELAEKGTLYLDEIGSVTLSSQAKLLRFLEDNEVVRIGGTKAKKIDVRIITTTNKDIPELTKTGKFRKDLFFRLNVIPLLIPPLRERREDILPLINFFLKKFNKKFDTKKRISPKALKCLTSYAFPGNVRELSNIIERAVVLSEGQEIGVSDFPVEVVGEREYGGLLPSREADFSLKEKTRSFEAMLIAKALRKCGSQRKAAKVLRVDQSTIARKVRQLGLSKEMIVE